MSSLVTCAPSLSAGELLSSRATRTAPRNVFLPVNVSWSTFLVLLSSIYEHIHLTSFFFLENKIFSPSRFYVLKFTIHELKIKSITHVILMT